MYSIGENVVHPQHGAGQVTDIKEMKIAGVKREYYVVHFFEDNLVSDIPIDNSDKIGLREVISPEEAKKVLEFFRSYDVGEDINWNRRQRENMAKLKSGDIYQVSTVLKELLCREKRKGLSTSERKTLGLARQIVVSELIISGFASESDILMILEDSVLEAIGE